MIIDGWLNWTKPVPGPSEKTYTQSNAGSGIALHSMEGGYASALRELMRAERQASWMFSNPFEGVLIQHYPTTASCWASGNGKANTLLWSVESEGSAGTPLNVNQVENMVRLCRDWESYRRDKGFSPMVATRNLANRSLWEHKEVALWAEPNAGPTACPSGRYQPLYDALEGTMTEAQIKTLVDEAIAAQFLPLLKQVVGVDPSTFSDEAGRVLILAALNGGGGKVGRHAHNSTITTVVTGRDIIQ